MLRGVRGGVLGRLWAHVGDGSREQAVVWPHGGFPESARAAPLSVRGWGARSQCLRAGVCIPVLRPAFSPCTLRTRTSHGSMATSIPQRGACGGALRKGLGEGTAGSGQRAAPREGGGAALGPRCLPRGGPFLAPRRLVLPAVPSDPEGGREGTGSGLYCATLAPGVHPEVEGAGGP